MRTKDTTVAAPCGAKLVLDASMDRGGRIQGELLETCRTLQGHPGSVLPTLLNGKRWRRKSEATARSLCSENCIVVIRQVVAALRSDIAKKETTNRMSCNDAPANAAVEPSPALPL